METVTDAIVKWKMLIEKENMNIVRLEFEEGYPDFPTFYKESKKIIYRSIIDVFEKTKDKEDGMKLIVRGWIEEKSFDTEFPIGKSNADLLMELINPYFESIEEYETCGRIVKLYSELKG